MKRIALLLAIAVYVASLTGCGCCRRFRGTFCRGTLCGGSRAPLLGSMQAPGPAPMVMPPQVYTQPQIVTAPPVYQQQVVQPQVIHPQVVQPHVVSPQHMQPQYMQPQMMAPHCVPCQPVCPCPAPCPCPNVCEPCCENYGDGYGDCGCSNYGGNYGCTSCGNSGDCSSCGSDGYVEYGDSCDGNAPFGINVAPGEYLGEIETSGEGWNSSPTPAGAGLDPGPGN